MCGRLDRLRHVLRGLGGILAHPLRRRDERLCQAEAELEQLLGNLLHPPHIGLHVGPLVVLHQVAELDEHPGDIADGGGGATDGIRQSRRRLVTFLLESPGGRAEFLRHALAEVRHPYGHLDDLVRAFGRLELGQLAAAQEFLQLGDGLGDITNDVGGL